MVTIHFVTENDIGARLIRWFTWSDFSHVEFVLPDGRWYGARLDGGVRARDPYPVTRRQVFEVDAPEDVYHFALSQENKPYDFTAILSMPLRHDLPHGAAWRADDSWFCSELVAWCFDRAGLPLLRADHLKRITPRDLLLSPLLRSVSPGSVNQIGHGG